MSLECAVCTGLQDVPIYLLFKQTHRPNKEKDSTDLHQLNTQYLVFIFLHLNGKNYSVSNCRTVREKDITLRWTSNLQGS
jgi:hypothetical protein